VQGVPIFAEPPMPLRAVTTLPSFPADAFPPVLADMVGAVAEATQTDVAMPGTCVIGVLSAAVGGRVEIEARPGWREGLNTYTVTVAGPGERKSAVQATLTAPLRDEEADMAAKGAGARLEAETLARVAEMAAERARKQAAAAEGAERDRLRAEAVSMADMAAAISIPAVPRLLADDITGEAVASLLAEQHGRLAVISAEGGIFDIIGGRYSHNIPQLDVWLKGHAGDPLRIDRKMRPPEYIKRPALSIALMVQPDVLAAIGRNGAFRGRGLLARFLYALPESKVGHRRAGAPPVPGDIVDAYAGLVRQLARSCNEWAGDPMILRLDTAASARLIALEEAH
jgi:hypothetical protein